MNNRTHTLILSFGVIAVCVLAGLLFLAANCNTIHALSICSCCGARVVTDTHYFTWSTEAAGRVDEIVSARPTLLSEFFNESSSCSHGGFAGMVNGKLSGPEKGDYLILIESETGTLLGRLGPSGHATGIGKWTYEYFYQPGDPMGASIPGFDSVRFQRFLLDKKKMNPGYPEQFRHVIQTEHPTSNSLVKDLIIKFKDLREGNCVVQ